MRQAQVKAAVQVNTALLTFYWELGADIAVRQKSVRWGSGFLKQLSADLMAEFSEMKGVSYNNLQYIKRCYLFYAEGFVNYGASCSTIVEQAAGQLPGKTGNSIAKQSATQLADSSMQSLLVAKFVRGDAH